MQVLNPDVNGHSIIRLFHQWLPIVLARLAHQYRKPATESALYDVYDGHHSSDDFGITAKLQFDWLSDMQWPDAAPSLDFQWTINRERAYARHSVSVVRERRLSDLPIYHADFLLARAVYDVARSQGRAPTLELDPGWNYLRRQGLQYDSNFAMLWCCLEHEWDEEVEWLLRTVCAYDGPIYIIGNEALSKTYDPSSVRRTHSVRIAALARTH